MLRAMMYMSISITLTIFGVLLSYYRNPSKFVNNTNDLYKIKQLPLTDSSLKKVIEYYDLQYPEIVFAQAILETGYYTSNICINNNNLFGLYNSRAQEFYKFKHWTESVKAYKDYVQRKYKPPDCYYKFLEELPYATDSLYIFKIKKLVKKYK